MTQLKFKLQSSAQFLTSLGDTVTIADVCQALHDEKHFTSASHAFSWLMANYPKLKGTNYTMSQKVSLEGGLAMFQWTCRAREWLD